MLQALRFLVSKTFLINIIIAILLVAGGLFGVLKYMDSYTLHGQLIEVPNLVDLHFSEIDSTLKKEHEFTPVINDSVYFKEKMAGTILEQDPLPETTVKKGRKIYLTVAAAEADKIAMPNLVDMSLRRAISLMETFDLEVGELKYRPDLCVNCILAQEIDGEEVEEGTKIPIGTSIDFVVGEGLGTERVGVPYLIGLKVVLASELLQSKSLNVGSLLYDETVLSAEDSLKAVVYKQIPAYEEEPTIRMGSSVDLFLTVDTNRVIHTVNPSDSI